MKNKQTAINGVSKPCKTQAGLLEDRSTGQLAREVRGALLEEEHRRAEPDLEGTERVHFQTFTNYNIDSGARSFNHNSRTKEVQ